MDAKKFLKRLNILPKIIENCEIEKKMWEDRAYNTTAGGVSIAVQDQKGKNELHNMEKVQTSSCSDPVGVAVANYVDIEEKIAALKAEKEKAESIMEQLEPNHYEVLYKFYILEYRLYEIADSKKKSYSLISKYRKDGIDNLQKLLDSEKL